MDERRKELRSEIRDAEGDLDEATRDKYAELTEEEVKRLVVEDKWKAALEGAIGGEVERGTTALVARVADLAERYERALPELMAAVRELEERVNGHLEAMGFAWN